MGGTICGDAQSGVKRVVGGTFLGGEAFVGDVVGKATGGYCLAETEERERRRGSAAVK